MPRGTIPVQREFVRPQVIAQAPHSADLARPVLRNARKSRERAPSQALLDRVTRGYFVQLTTPDAVRFWARVERINGEELEVTVANEMPRDLDEPLAMGDRIAARAHHIFAIRSPRCSMDE